MNIKDEAVVAAAEAIKNGRPFRHAETARAALEAALPHMGGVSEEMLIAAFLRGESWRKRNDVDRYVAVPKMVQKAARDYADATLSTLASHEPASEAQRGVEDAEERVAEIPSGTLLDDLPDEVLFGDHSDENPAVRQPDPEPAKDGPEVVERLRKWCSETINQWSDEYEPRENWERQVSGAMREWDKATTEIISDYEALRAENERLRIERITAERDAADYMKRLNKAAGKLSIAENVIAELVKALDQLLDDMGENGLCVCQAAKDQAIAALGGQSNE